MKAVNTKVRCTKIKLDKSEGVIKLYDKIQIAFAKQLDCDERILKIETNVSLEDFSEGKFSSDFLCLKTDGEYMVRECVFRDKLSLPRTIRLLDASYNYWIRRGVFDWGIVIDEEKESAEIYKNKDDRS